ncbi:hypothetical protein BDV06DRAFT_222702 [Aspergillus oleicola]
MHILCTPANPNTAEDSLTRTILNVIVRNAYGGDEEAPLQAALDETIEGNIIVRHVSQQLHDHLKLDNTPFYPATSLLDSHAISYTAHSKVDLSVEQVNGTSSHIAPFYVSHNESGPLGGGFHIILGKDWRRRFRIPNESGVVSYGAAPTVIHGSSAEKKAREADAKKRQDEARKRLRQVEDSKRKKDGKGPGGQSASSTR